jgi:hypothetical protein
LLGRERRPRFGIRQQRSKVLKRGEGREKDRNKGRIGEEPGRGMWGFVIFEPFWKTSLILILRASNYK